MNAGAVAYASPWVPPEWIAAHRLVPCWMRLGSTGARRLAADRRGVCPYAGAMVDAVLDGQPASGVVATTTCDQMRYAAAVLHEQARLPVFLLNVPSTWQTPGTAELFRDELARAYFDAIPDAFQRPNDRLYDWLSTEIAARGVRGVVFRRYVWCDLWHAELPRLKRSVGVPVLELDAVDGDQSARGRTTARVEAFLEMLR